MTVHFPTENPTVFERYSNRKKISTEVLWLVLQDPKRARVKSPWCVILCLGGNRQTGCHTECSADAQAKNKDWSMDRHKLSAKAWRDRPNSVATSNFNLQGNPLATVTDRADHQANQNILLRDQNRSNLSLGVYKETRWMHSLKTPTSPKQQIPEHQISTPPFLPFIFPHPLH
jgi:hypothetical protein